jgi:hypothetical protein
MEVHLCCTRFSLLLPAAIMGGGIITDGFQLNVDPGQLLARLIRKFLRR